MATKAVAVIAGVGPGTGASIARRFAKSYAVALLGRNPDNYGPIVQDISSNGGRAIGISTDVADKKSVSHAFDEISKAFPDMPMAAAVYNVGSGLVRKPFLELSQDEFTGGFMSSALGAFHFSQAAIPLLLQGSKLEHPPTLLFTGATASLKGSAQMSPFATGKFALRALSQSLAREYGAQGIHVGHVIVDGIIDIDKTKHINFEASDSKLSPDAIADTYWYLHSQPRTAFTHELDLRPYVEKW